MIELIPLDEDRSRQVQAWGYDEPTQTFSVHFKKSNFRYDYQGIPREVAEKVMGADSPGKAINEHIKGEGYAFEKIDLSQEGS